MKQIMKWTIINMQLGIFYPFRYPFPCFCGAPLYPRPPHPNRVGAGEGGSENHDGAKRLGVHTNDWHTNRRVASGYYA